MTDNNINEFDTGMPEDALKLLKEGHKRFKNNQLKSNVLLHHAKIVSAHPAPFAAVLTCMDSRVPPELIFDQGFGNIFTLRLAGNIAAPQVLGSLEYVVSAAGIRLIIVLGHTRCAAVKAACNFVNTENLYTVINDIQACISNEQTEMSDRTGENASFVDKVAQLHVIYATRKLEERSSLLRQYVYNHTLCIIPAIYHVDTGDINWL